MNERFVALAIACAVALSSGIGLILSRRLVRSAGLLLVHSLAIAAVYFVLGAEFMAVGQVVVYSGAIVVLFLFVVLLLPDGGTELPIGKGRALAGAVAGLAMLAALGLAMRAMLDAGPPEATAAADLSVRAIARALFGAQIAPFELTALLLLIAIVGAVALWHRGEKGETP
jgi:NADH-quinone oxidoreductase subunit J